MKEHGHHHNFNLRVLYYDDGSPKLKYGSTTDCILWNVITLYYHEYVDEGMCNLFDIKKMVTDSPSIMAPYVNTCINFVLNEMAAFCNAHPVPDPRPHKKGEMMPLPIDEFPIWFDNLENLISDLTWSGKDRKILIGEVLPRLLNSFEYTYAEALALSDFSVKDSDEVDLIIEEVIKLNPDIVANYKKGKLGLINKLFGEVMKLSGGKIDVKTARSALEKKLIEA
jgi:Asp-tRNA(Asn)/Glu-tRNA(Gln) amidotransferase B subunit